MKKLNPPTPFPDLQGNNIVAICEFIKKMTLGSAQTFQVTPSQTKVLIRIQELHPSWFKLERIARLIYSMQRLSD